MIASLGRLVMAWLALTVVASTALAQGNTFNPYGNSGYADYREYGSPQASDNLAMPGATRLNSVPLITKPRANRFQEFVDSLDGADPDSTTRGTIPGVPYYESFRQYDRQYERVYRPNKEADKGFEERLRKRDEAYRQALKEKDPAKRALLLRKIDRDSLDRPATPKGRAGATPAAAKSKASTKSATAPLSRAPSPYSSGARRSTAPPPTTPGRSTSPSGRSPAAPDPNRAATRREPSSGGPPDPSTIAEPRP